MRYWVKTASGLYVLVDPVDQAIRNLSRLSEGSEGDVPDDMREAPRVSPATKPDKTMN